MIGAVEMIGMNEALMLAKREDILDEIVLALEAFTDDILPAVGESTFPLSRPSRMKLLISWCLPGSGRGCKREFQKSLP